MKFLPMNIESLLSLNAALVFLDTDEYAQRNVLVGILRGVPVKVPKDKTHDE